MTIGRSVARRLQLLSTRWCTGSKLLGVQRGEGPFMSDWCYTLHLRMEVEQRTQTTLHAPFGETHAPPRAVGE